MPRRGFVAWCSAVAAAVLAGNTSLWADSVGAGSTGHPLRCHGHPAGSGDYEHPDPRPGIDASGVLPVEELSAAPHAVAVFDKIREIPEIADGVLCHCGCDHGERYPSLLVCYEKGGMAMWCEVCQGEGNLIYRLHKSGKSLDQIRVAVDAKFG
jgi:hypothetical protein